MKIRKLTQAVLAVACGAVIAISTTVSALAQGVVIKGEPDGQNKTTVVDEHFYSGSLEPNFSSDTVSVTTDSYAMHFAGAYYYGSALVLTAYKMKDYNRFTYSVDMLETNDGFLYCGFGGADERTLVGSYDFNICLSKGITALSEMGGLDAWNTIGSLQLNNALSVGKTTEIAVTLERASGKDYKVTFELLEKGEAIATTDYGTLVRMDHSDGYFCMWSGQNEVFNVRDFKVYDSPTHLAFSDDFVNSSLSYGAEPADKSYWHINTSSLSENDVFICRNAGPEFKKAGDMITAKNKLEMCDKVSKPYEIAFDARIKSLSKGTFGIFLGASKANSLENATVIGVSTYDSKYASVHLVKNGKVVDYGENLIPLSVLNIDDIAVRFEAVICGDRSIIVTVGGIQVVFNNIRYDGYWGICNSTSDKSAADVKLDTVTVIQNTYTDCAQPDLSNNFAGIKLTQDGFEEYYISDRTYYIGPGISLRPKGAFTTEPSLYFENAGPYSAFAPKLPYTDFILQFDVKMVSDAHNSQWFGVNFGKNSYAAISDTCAGINFEYSAWDPNTPPFTQMVANLCTFDNGEKIKKIDDYHFFKDQETKYNFMFVAKNRTVYVYFKEDSEDISKLGICRAVIPNINTAGYVAIFGVSGLSFDVFNYKLTNLAPEATADSAIALRENFDGKALSDKLATEGAAEVKDGAMQLSGGSLSMKNPSRFFITDFTLLNANADVAVSFADNKSVILSKDLSKITVNDGAKKNVFDVSKYNLADNKNTQFEFIVQYDALSIAAKGVYDPVDKLATPIVEYTFASPVAAGILKWVSQDALLDNLAVYALDQTYQAASVSYEQDPNDADFWLPKSNVKKQSKTEKEVTTDSEKDAGMPIVFIVIYAVLGAVILGLAVVLIVMLVKRKGKAQ